jgi:hypothetical protein
MGRLFLALFRELRRSLILTLMIFVAIFIMQCS